MIPTAVSPAEQDFLSELANDRIVYEAGALLGASTIALAKRAKLVISVDPHDGYPRKDPSSTWDLFKLHIEQAGVVGRVQPVRAKFQDCLPLANYGFAFADLTGEFNLTLEFLEATKHIPKVGIHDYARTGCEGVAKAVDSFLKSNRRKVLRVGSLIVLETGEVC